MLRDIEVVFVKFLNPWPPNSLLSIKIAIELEFVLRWSSNFIR